MYAVQRSGISAAVSGTLIFQHGRMRKRAEKAMEGLREYWRAGKERVRANI